MPYALTYRRFVTLRPEIEGRMPCLVTHQRLVLALVLVPVPVPVPVPVLVMAMLLRLMTVLMLRRDQYPEQHR